MIFPEELRRPLLAAGFATPTSIQQYCWPVAVAGRDVIGVAKTGSGKTLAFLFPCFGKILQDPRRYGTPAIVTLAPTRELACQIEVEAKKFGGPAGFRTVCCYGGAPKGEQLAKIRERPQVLVATPGRLNDFLEARSVTVRDAKFLILDEADRMLDMGFEPQIRKIIQQCPSIREGRQTMMFTATWPASVRRLASEFLSDPVEVRIGNPDSLKANADISQDVVFVDGIPQK